MARKITGLTNTQVERSKYDPNGKNELNDGNGLFLELKPTGTKVWRFRYNHPVNNKRTKTTIGNYPEITLAQARQQREEWRALLAQGIDPQTYRARIARELELAEANTFLSVAEKWREKKLGEIEEKTVRKYWGSLELHILPFIGSYPISEIVPSLALVPLERVQARNNIDMANRLASYINEILNFAVNGGLIPFNPCLKMAKNLKKHTKKNNPHVKPEELPKLLQDIDQGRSEKQTRKLIMFSILTMVRPGEARKAEWSEIDFENKVWTIPAGRMKARSEHTVPLSNQAITLLKQLQPITGRFKYVFPKRGDNNHYMSEGTANGAIKRVGYSGIQTAHGLRGLVRTYLGEEGEVWEHAEACLAHKTGGNVSLAYNHATYLEQRKAIMQKWADYVEQCAQGSNLLK